MIRRIPYDSERQIKFRHIFMVPQGGIFLYYYTMNANLTVPPRRFE